MTGPAQVFIGSDPQGERRYAGLLQDVRLYKAKLNRSHIHELHTRPPKSDLRTISGYLRYRQDERQKSFVVEVRDDDEEEGEEVFYLQLVAARGGARLPVPRPTAVLRVMKSDNANGLFGFTGACIPDVSGLTYSEKFPAEPSQQRNPPPSQAHYETLTLNTLHPEHRPAGFRFLSCCIFYQSSCLAAGGAHAPSSRWDWMHWPSRCAVSGRATAGEAQARHASQGIPVEVHQEFQHWKGEI